MRLVFSVCLTPWLKVFLRTLGRFDHIVTLDRSVLGCEGRELLYNRQLGLQIAAGSFAEGDAVLGLVVPWLFAIW